jgi:LAO/AO transport system kinase
MVDDENQLSDGVLAGDRRAIAKAITLVENGAAAAAAFLAALHPKVGRARRIGITGPPGAGKSTLVGVLVKAYRQTEEHVGVLAIDPTSPFSGGALLGDRVRMSSLSVDPGVFIRSMASRGAFGGLARATWDAVDVLDASGANPVLIETVGVGQTEVEIAAFADTTLVVLSPESGDNVQAMKAGLMEIADIFVVNKSDRDGADIMARDIDGMLDVRGASHEEEATAPDVEWRPPVVKVSAAKNQGIETLLDVMDAHRKHLEAHGGLEARRRGATRRRMLDMLDQRIRERFWTDARHAALEDALDRVVAKKLDPAAAVDGVVGNG